MKTTLGLPTFVLVVWMLATSVACEVKHDFAAGAVGAGKHSGAGPGGTVPGTNGRENPDGTEGSLRGPGSSEPNTPPTTGNPSNPGQTGPGPTGPVDPVGDPLPEVTQNGPECIRQSQCAHNFELVEPAKKTLTFNWRTNDEYYKTHSTVDGRVVGQPNVHYVPGSGVVTFQPGERKKTIYVQNINPYSYALYIPLWMTECQSGSLSVSCRDIFR